MVPFLVGECDTLEGVPQALKNRVHFLGHLQWLKGYLGFTDQESVHRCGQGCSTYLGLDF